jgi:hypothetical protein
MEMRKSRGKLDLQIPQKISKSQNSVDRDISIGGDELCAFAYYS